MVFTGGCTQSINSVIKGVVRQGDHVIISNLEHNAVVRPIVKIGVDYSVAEVSPTDDSITIENFRRLLKPNTRLIFVTAASNVTGRKLPIASIGSLCRERGVLFGVDAAQTAGIVPIDMERENIDFLCVAAHKGLYAPMGIGVLIARQPIENTLIEGGTGMDSINTKQPESMPERMESGTLNLPGILGLGAGIDFVKNRGVEQICEYEMLMIQKLFNEFQKMPQIELYTPFPNRKGYVPVLPFNIKGVSSGKTAMYLNKNDVAVRSGLHCAPSAHKAIKTLENGTVRICPCVFNNMQEIYKVIRLIKNYNFL